MFSKHAVKQKWSIALTLCLPLVTSTFLLANPPADRAEANPTGQPESIDPSAVEPSTTEKQWGVQLLPIDRWMRMHLLIPSKLAPAEMKLLVESVDPGSAAETWGILPGDILLESDRGLILHSEQIGPPSSVQFFRILRHGQPFLVHRRHPKTEPLWQNPLGNFPPMAPFNPVMPLSPVIPPRNPSGESAMAHSSGSSASSYSSNGSAVAISQTNSQVKIEVAENGQTHRFQGNLDEIRQQLQGAKLSPATTAKIESALQQMEGT